MENSNIVMMTKEEYSEYIILKHYAELKHELNLSASERFTSIATEITKQVNSDLDAFFEHFFRRSRMGTDSRAEQTTVGGFYFGFDAGIVEWFKTLGITVEQCVSFIERQWDIVEKEENSHD